jgi:hypothetical protein
MEPSEMVAALEDLAAHLGVEIRREFTNGAGGLCILKGRRFLVIPADATPDEQIDVMASALAGLDTEDVYLVPAVRDLLESYTSERR